jgi:hypothetical protein
LVGAIGEGETKKDDSTRRRRVQRAESGLKAYELGAEVGKRVAGRLERHRSQKGDGLRLRTRPFQVEEEKASEEARPPRLRAATPSQLLGSPPDSSFSVSPSPTPFSPTLAPLQLPPAPTLEPLFVPSDQHFPAVHTPFTLDPLDPLDDGYFGLKRRRTRRDSLLQPGEESFSPSKPTFSLPSVSTSPPTWRSRTLDFFIYLLIGSFTSPSSSAPSSLDTSLSSLGGFLGLLVHTFGFLFFLIYHLSALIYSSYFALRRTGVWACWAGRNLTGRTEVSRSVVRYGRTCYEQWCVVAEESGEKRMSAWGVGRALVELAVLQSSAFTDFLLHPFCC